ncbi:hypothetical protein [uncultured Bacteroides sp.]|uniref:hypothetical protein n=1 Tax=uncultured Bacteroides sp. TaxID=162156 RepID=UPI002633645D|nr:hypothetical protein [uncultured Bacteroides sp.]
MNKELEELYTELEKVKSSADEYLPEYGYSHKDEVIQLIEEDIEDLENEMNNSEYFCSDDEIEMERTSLCMSLGISRYC